jgi:hypothetical protein
MNKLLYILVGITIFVLIFNMYYSCTVEEGLTNVTTDSSNGVVANVITDSSNNIITPPGGNVATDSSSNPINDATGVAFVAGPNNTMVALQPTGDLGKSSIYYEPGTYRFGASTYVPSYEDSIYLSKTTGQSTVTTYLDEASIKGGSCSYYKNQPDKLEEMCMAVNKNNCGAMSCCVLLGGSKCVSGSKLGPSNKLNYGDITVKDKDYYYHMGKCYGNCK